MTADEFMLFSFLHQDILLPKEHRKMYRALQELVEKGVLIR